MSFPLRDRLGQVARLRPFDTSTAEGRALERRRRAGLTIIANFVARVASFSVITLASRLALESMGVVRFGIWMTIAGFIALLNFLDFGIGNGLIGPIARSSEDDASSDQARLITMGLAATLVVGLISGALLTMGAVSIPLDWLFHGIAGPDLAEARSALWVFAVLLGISLPLQTINRVFVGMQRAYVTHVLSIITSLGMAALLLAMRHKNLTIVDYVFVTFGSLQLPGLLSLIVLIAERKILPGTLRGTRLAEYRPLFAVGAAFLALQAGALIGWGCDQILVSVMRGPAEAGVYAIAVRIFMLASIPLYIANAPMWAVYAHAIERGDMHDVRKGLRLSLLGSLAGAGALCLAIVIAGPMVWNVFSGGHIPYASTLMIAFALWTVIDCTANALAMFLNGAHIIRPQLLTVGVFVVLAIPIKIAVIGRYGIAAIPLVTVAIYLLTLAVVYTVSLRAAILKVLSGKASAQNVVDPAV